MYRETLCSKTSFCKVLFIGRFPFCPFLSQLGKPFEAKVLYARDSVAQSSRLSSYFMINMRELDSDDPLLQSANEICRWLLSTSRTS